MRTHRVIHIRLNYINIIWNKVYKNGPSEICGRQSLKNLKPYGLFKQTISLQIFKGWLSQILLELFLNALSHKYEVANNSCATD